ncbi:peroxiredoxin [Haloplanus aerogenes]|uniref:thioredoxin-dependent peroxiredoxin n=1 Tax=Haloplanus aerogenes TaxID=660522 RepID=A0A3M0D1L7_9EURY|nr:peroxiredoxin [Haloplanus aerogenes]AZH23872.1 peroxiredoxin [Haloplanus aerogenes]RMB13369.1 peroxiredoxin Q/BCP [Haloplanus aerogenes]
MLAPGDPAPDVSTRNQDGETVTLAFSDPTVVYFYPRDFTGGCTTEASEFQAALAEFHELGVSVYGVSTDDVATHADFAAAEGLQFDLLADPDGSVASAFGVDVADGAAERVTFLLADGEVIERYEQVDPDGHAREVLTDARREFVAGG